MEDQIMSKHTRYIVAMAALLCFARVDAQTAMPPAMQAEIETVYTLANGDQFTRRGHIYRSASGKVRQDSGNGAMITDFKSGTVTLLIDEKNEARVFKIPPELRTAPLLGTEQARVPAKVAPFEETVIDGRPIAKTRIVGPQGEMQELWTATDIGVVTFARVQMNGTTTTQQLRKLSVGEPDPQVFTVPSHYKVIEEPTRFDSRNARVPLLRDLPFGAGTRVVPMSPPSGR
jgi:hypothetical protein